MLVSMLKSKLHCARVTDARLDYEGSLTIDRGLMDAVGILPYEKIMVANLESGDRFETYAIPGASGSGTLCLNGATAHKGAVGDRVIVFAFCLIPAGDAASHRPRIVRLDEHNRPEGGLRPV